MKNITPGVLCFFLFSIPVFASQASFESEVAVAGASIYQSNSLSEIEILAEIEKSTNPVIITVAGLNFGKIGCAPFDFENFKKLIGLFFSRKSIDSVTFEEEFYKEYADYFNGELNSKHSNSTRWPDNYLEQKVRGLSANNRDVLVIPFVWSRDPADTDKTIPEFESKFKQIYALYGGKRPIFIVAHSWGSVLIHETLNRLEKSAPYVRIDRLITLGSPLVPSNFLVKLFMKLEISKEDLLKKVIHPSNLRYWKNIWAKRDIYSNAIPVADFNVQIDENVENLEPTLLDIILHNRELRSLAKKDFLVFRDIRAWHGSYIFDYRAYLESLNREIYLEVFNPIIVPQLLEYDRKGK